MSMQNSIYGGIPGPSWYVFDKVHIGSAKDLLNQASSDGIFIGRYVLVKYCESLLEAEERTLLESLSSETQILDDPTGDKKLYFTSYKQDGATQSYDRVVFQKIYKNNKITYHAICNLHQIQNIIIQPGEGGGGTVVNPIRIAMIDPDPPEATDNDILQNIINNNQGDIVIIRRQIANDKYSHTAYVYDNTLGWTAMDGNYSADNVYFDNDITLAGSYTTVGNITKTSNSAIGTLEAKGKNLAQVMQSIFTKELYPNANDKPKIAIEATDKNGEVGSHYNAPQATLKVTSVGTYPYGDQATGITFAENSIKLAEGADLDNATNFVTNSEEMGKNSALTLTAENGGTYTDEDQIYIFSASASYPDGKIPVTNLGNEYSDAQIKADTIVANKKIVYSGWRYIFSGSTAATTIDSKAIRNLTKALPTIEQSVPTASGGKGIKFNAVKDDTKVIFAYPTSWTTKTPKFEIYTMAWGATDGFEESTISVADATGTDGYQDYAVYTYTPAGPFETDITEYCVYFT